MRLIFFILFLSTLTYAQGQQYFIKFGSFKNIKGLTKSIDKLPNYLRSHVVIFHANGWYVPIAYMSTNKRALYPKIKPYKRYFPDTHIAKSSTIFNYPVVKNYVHPKRTVSKTPKPVMQRRVVESRETYVQAVHDQMPQQVKRVTTSQNLNVPLSEEKRTPEEKISLIKRVKTPSMVKRTIIVPTVVNPDDFKVQERIQYKNFTQEMVSGQYYYLAYMKTKENPNLLIKVSFSSDEVTYQPVIGDMKMTKASYLVDGDRLYMFTNEFTKDGAYSKLEYHKKNYFVVSSWVNGTKLNTLRYYYKLNDAKRYLGLDTSTGLAEVLQDGEFDTFPWN